MALRNAPQAAAATERPPFEVEDADVAVAEAPVETFTAPTQPVQPPTAYAAPAVARPAGAVSTNTKPAAFGSPCVVKGLEHAIPTESLERMSFGVFPRVTVDQAGGFVRDKDQEEYGKEIEIEVLSWNPVFLVTTGEQNDTEANKLVRTSYDGVNLIGGEGLITDYVNKLKVDGYNRATTKQYVEIWANLLWTKEKGHIPLEDQTMVQLSVSPQSVGQFERYMLETSLKRARGLQDSNVLNLTGSKKTTNGNTYGVITFAVGKHSAQ